MKFNKSHISLLVLLLSVTLASLLSATVTGNNYSESYPAVVCPPTLNGLSSQVSISARTMQFQQLANRSTKTIPFKSLRYSIPGDAIVVSANGATPVVWQSRASSWAGGVICAIPSSSQWFVGGTANVTTRGRLVLTNSGLSDAIVDIQSYSENGKQPIKSVTLKSKSSMQLSLDAMAPGDKYLAIQVSSRSGRVNAFMIDEQGSGLRALGGDFVNSYPGASTSILIPAIPNQLSKKGQKAASSHMLRILAPGDVNTSFTAEILSADGNFVPVGFNSRTIDAGIVTEFELSPNISASAFAVRLTSQEPIVAAVSSSVVNKGRKDYVWSTAAPELTPMTMAITGLSPIIAFAGDSIAVKIAVKLVNGKSATATIKGTDIATWRAPANARSFTIISTSKSVFAGALVDSDNGFGYFPVQSGSKLTRIEVPSSNIRVLNP